MTHEERFTTSHWKTLLQQVVLEVQHMASICQVALDAPGVAERVLANDGYVAGHSNPAALKKLRDLMLLHHAVIRQMVDELGGTAAVTIAEQVSQHLAAHSHHDPDAP
jgi:hypothetical protein